MSKGIVQILCGLLMTLGVLSTGFCNEIKLLCHINLIETHVTGSVERSNIKEIIEVYDLKNFISIIPQSASIASVTTQKHKFITSVENFSNATKWDIKNSGIHSGNAYSSRIVIDRNTGLLWYERSFNDGKLTITGTGTCEKVLQEKKKF